MWACDRVSQDCKAPSGGSALCHARAHAHVYLHCIDQLLLFGCEMIKGRLTPDPFYSRLSRRCSVFILDVMQAVCHLL